MRHFLSAVRFLTVLTIGPKDSDLFEPAQMLPWFPLVGLLIGTLLALVDRTALWLWPKPVAALLDLLFLVWVTGALHLDGLGDTADGLYGNRPRDKALAIMKDSRMGAMGVVAIFFALAAKWGALGAIAPGRLLVLICVPALARGAQVLAMGYLPYGRSEGLGSQFCAAPLSLRAHGALLIPMGLLLFLGMRGLCLLAVYAGICFAVIRFYKSRMGCITGDMIGALSEVCEAGLLLAAAAGGSF
jgi:adenosylcobinamide-GDP ribazoletransferase